jgi:hypothetical protein
LVELNLRFRMLCGGPNRLLLMHVFLPSLMRSSTSAKCNQLDMKTKYWQDGS